MKNELPSIGKRWIRPLPERLINKIAAGEVIERPAAVLKELVENSLDAGAGKIDIIIEKSGTRLITVIDNGCGIEPEQIEIAFARHATSKIGNFADLENLRSYGFRGEALPSIASVSRTRMISKTAGGETGIEIIIEGGVIQSRRPTAAPIGTKVEVENLFFNTPARRKFLKAESTEARHLTRNAIALALGAPGIKFSYSINGRNLFSLDDNSSNIKARVGQLLLGEGGNRLFEVMTDSEEMKILGYLAYPDQCRQNQYGLYIFINNRYIKSQGLTHAIASGYGESLPRGNYPVGAVFLTINPAKVDVNVHPTKAEVRLSDEKLVHDLLYQAIKRSLRESGMLPPVPINAGDFSKPSGYAVGEAAGRGGSFTTERIPQNLQPMLNKLYGREEAESGETGVPSASELPGDGKIETQSSAGQWPGPRREELGVGRIESLETAAYLGQVAGLYLVFRDGEDILIIDQHAAHERILYEENIKSIEAGGAVAQNLLFPASIELSADRFALYEESEEILRAAGFAVEPFGPGVVLLSAVPLSLGGKSPEKLLLKIIDDIEIIRRAGSDLKKAVAQSLACRSAVMAGDRLGAEEALNLLRRLFLTDNGYCCPHGRPTVLKITKKELDGKFGRK